MYYAMSTELQPLTTVEGDRSFTQPAAGWIDANPFDTVQLYLVVKRNVNGILQVQSSPSTEDDFFITMSGAQVIAGIAEPTVVVLPTAQVPLMRYVRWHVAAPMGHVSMTFRIVALFRRAR